MDSNYINWDKERSGIINDTLDVLRDQRDNAQQQDFNGVISYNPQTFVAADYNPEKFDKTKPPKLHHLVIGPVKFDSAFDKSPVVTFGQATQANDLSVSSPATSVATEDTPFLVVPYVYRWNFTNGKIDGFYLALYALTAPSGAATNQVVYWRAIGPASAYLNQFTEDSWVDGYENANTDFLTVDTGAADDSTSGDSSTAGADLGTVDGDTSDDTVDDGSLTDDNSGFGGGW